MQVDCQYFHTQRLIAARVQLKTSHVQQILILDLDVHQGDGTAEIFAGDPSVFTLSVHGAKNYPFHKRESDLDLELEDGMDDQGYLEAVRPVILETLDQRWLNFLSVQITLYRTVFLF